MSEAAAATETHAGGKPEGGSALLQAWLVIVLSLVFGGALAWMQLSLQPKIEANKLDETRARIPSLVPGADGGKEAQVGGKRVFRAMKGGEQVGGVVPGVGQGFADKIEVLIGLDKEGRTLTGIYVLDQKETPGLGNKIEEEAWRDQYKGKEVTPALQVTKGAASGNQIQAVTGATISSVAVTDIVNQTVGEMQPQLAQALEGGN